MTIWRRAPTYKDLVHSRAGQTQSEHIVQASKEADMAKELVREPADPRPCKRRGVLAESREEVR